MRASHSTRTVTLTDRHHSCMTAKTPATTSEGTPIFVGFCAFLIKVATGQVASVINVSRCEWVRREREDHHERETPHLF